MAEGASHRRNSHKKSLPIRRHSKREKINASCTLSEEKKKKRKGERRVLRGGGRHKEGKVRHIKERRQSFISRNSAYPPRKKGRKNRDRRVQEK